MLFFLRLVVIKFVSKALTHLTIWDQNFFYENYIMCVFKWISELKVFYWFFTSLQNHIMSNKHIAVGILLHCSFALVQNSLLKDFNKLVWYLFNQPIVIIILHVQNILQTRAFCFGRNLILFRIIIMTIRLPLTRSCIRILLGMRMVYLF